VRQPGPPRRARDRIRRFDAAVERRWERLRGRPALDRLFYAASELGDFSLVWHLLGAARSLAPGRGPADAARFSLTMGVESALVNGPVKALFGRIRPYDDDVVRPHRLRRPRTSSFPSGHASAAFTAAALLSDDASPLAAAGVYAVAAVVSASRVHVRIHHPSDVVAGALLGVALGRIALRVWASLPEPWGTR
jgi:undecaprenyl-diphosphatase